MPTIIAVIEQELGSYKAEMLKQYQTYMAQTLGMNRECIYLIRLRKAFTTERGFEVIGEIEKSYCYA